MLIDTRGRGELMMAVNSALDQYFSSEEKELFQKMTVGLCYDIEAIRIHQDKIINICDRWIDETNSRLDEVGRQLDILQARTTTYLSRERVGSSDSRPPDGSEIGAYMDSYKLANEYVNMRFAFAKRAIKLSKSTDFDPKKYSDIFEALFSVRKDMLEQYGKLIDRYQGCQEQSLKLEIESRKMALQEQEAKFNEFITKEKLGLAKECLEFEKQAATNELQLKTEKVQQQDRAAQEGWKVKKEKLKIQHEQGKLQHEEAMLQIQKNAEVNIAQLKYAKNPKQQGGCIVM